VTRGDEGSDAIGLAEAARLLGVSELRVVTLRREGLLARRGRRPAYSRADVLAFLERPPDVRGRPSGPPPAPPAPGTLPTPADPYELLARRLRSDWPVVPDHVRDGVADAARGDLGDRDDPGDRDVLGGLDDPGRTPSPLPPFPDLTGLVRRGSDARDRHAGGRCEARPDSLREQWEMVLAQHQLAFHHLVDTATGRDGWALATAVVVDAHRLCGLALRAAWVARTGSTPWVGHDLDHLWDRLDGTGALHHLDGEQAGEARDVLRVVAGLAEDRDGWCCLDVRTLRGAVYAFLEHVEQR
jgi:hypothetical protein